MIVRQPRVELADGRARLIARVESERGAFDPCDVSIGVPRAQADWLDTSGSPWVPTFLLLAAMLGERLRVEAPVSRRLLAGASRATRFFHDWWKLAPVDVEADVAPDDASPPGTETLACFTRGVDSWFTALRLLAPQATLRATGLIYAPDFDQQYTPARRREAARRTREAAERLGVPLLVVEDDARALLDRFVDWEGAHGGALAGIGLALGAAAGRFVIPATNDLRHLAPHGSHPELDPLWSTERTAVVHDAAEVSRTAKVRALAAVPTALARLKVCWVEDRDDNCGRCQKCLRTMLQLALAGALEAADVFGAPLSMDAFAALPPPHRERRRMLQAELYDSMPDDPAWAEWREVLRARLSSWHPAAVRTPAVPYGLRIVVEAPVETAIALASPLARGVLPGALVPSDDGAVDAPDVRRVEVTWARPAPGRAALPWRPPASAREAILAACRDPQPRPVPWCLIDRPTPGSAEVARALTHAWGPGVVSTPPHAALDADHGTPRAVATAIQRRAAIRVWRGDARGLDPFLVLESLRHGCLPLACVDADEYDLLVRELPAGLEAFLLVLDGPLDPVARGGRLDRGLSVVLAGSLERDLHHVLAGLAPAAA